MVILHINGTSNKLKLKIMTKEEFLKLTGLKEIEDKRFSMYEELYSAADVDKQTFCDMLNTFNFKIPIEFVFAVVTKLNNQIQENKSFLERMNNFHKEIVTLLTNHIDDLTVDDWEILRKYIFEKQIIKMKVAASKELNNTQKEILKNLLDEDIKRDMIRDTYESKN